jgi:hypothetical protein
MKKIHSLILSVTFIMSSLVMTSAHADNGFYIGGSVGNADTSGSTPSTDFSGSDTGYKIFGGFKFTIFAVEGGYVNFGKAENNGISAETTAFDLFGLVNIGLGPIDLFGKLGVFSWDSDLTEGTSVNEDGTDPVYGIGGGLSLGPVSVRLEYEYFDVGSDGLDDIQMISLGAVYFF